MHKRFSKVLCTVLTLATIISIQIPFANAATATFTDVPSSHWAHAAIVACADKGIVTGMGDGTFAPNDDLTYAQVFSMLVNASYADDEVSYKFSNAAAMDSYFGGNTPWWGYYAYFLNVRGLLDGTAAHNKVSSKAIIESGISRYEMVQIISNVLKDQRVSVAQSTIKNAEGAIADWAKVPATYQTAVATGYGLEIITGFDDHSFGGTSTLTRAQACVIFNKMLDVIAGGGTIAPGTNPGQSLPPVSGEKDIKVTLNGRAYSVADNGFTTGTLNNGLAATEENVIALLAKAQKQWPAGTTWNENTGTTLYYGTPSQVATSAIRTPYSINVQYGCGGYAAMISDYVFGSSASVRKTTVENIRPGDIIVKLFNGKSEHVFIATSRPYYSSTTRYSDAVKYTDGNNGDKIAWADPNSDGSMVSLTEQNWWNPGTTWEVWTRYDNSGAPANPQPPQPPQPPVSGETEIKVECATGYYAGAYTVGDNGFATGKLNNGLEINEANVTALLEKAKKEWPAGLVWAKSGTADNHWYVNAGSVVKGVILTGYGTAVNYACGGYAAMVSDYLFGHENNPARKTTIENIRPGDIIVILKNGKAEHVMIATSSIFTDDMGYTDCVWTTDGNNSGVVRWPDTKYGSPDSLTFSNQWASVKSTWEVWTRYPD